MKLGARVGVLGGGQLGRMLGLSGLELGLELLFLDPNPESPAAAVGQLVARDYEDAEGLSRIAEVDVVTFEFENVPAATAASMPAASSSWL